MTINRLTAPIKGRAEDKDMAIIVNKAILIKEALEADITAKHITKTKDIKETQSYDKRNAMSVTKETASQASILSRNINRRMTDSNSMPSISQIQI